MSNSYYVYALKDPRSNPAKIFYIGKGTGSRAWNHIINVDETRKGVFIKEIMESGKEVMVSQLVSYLTEAQALKIESELISSFGTIDAGGSLYNTVIPTGTVRRVQNNINVPTGVIDKAQIGINLLKDALEEFAEANPDGITNSDSAHYLGLQSDNDGKQQDYLTYSVLGILLKESRIISVKEGSRRKYKYAKNT
ncbi:MAG: GIY-YIG nuclease family protein [Candidatus Thioglobus sp.]|uniref:GIY-YIG nuclease family protein n=1 Tax=Candidatus Thioglobus sp. TaxID=2026721 RepID=UPI002628F31D|nr:GIY-YIG nuclease family protein [Candidatus Thioglobus sp.]MDC9727657.1 GIY-YIG nuclease family protein [Candidatus Thioglobus sp.]